MSRRRISARRAGHARSVHVAALIAFAWVAGSGCVPAPRDAGADDGDGPHVVALMYHRFADPAAYARIHGHERIYTIATDRFEEQLRRLAARGFRSVSAVEAVAFARGERDLPPRSVLITIDDGCRSILTRAAPLLRHYGFRATLFITTDATSYVFRRAADDPQLTPEELSRLAREGFEIGSHGETHRRMRDLSDSDLARELGASRRALAERTGLTPGFLSIPGNAYCARVLDAARRAGYEAAFTSDCGSIRRGSDLMKLPRNNVSGDWTIERFERLLNP